MSSTTVGAYIKNKKNFLLKEIEEIEMKCDEVEDTIKISALHNSKKNVFKICRIYCNKFSAEIHYFLEEYASSLDFIREAFKKLYEKDAA